MDPTSTSPDLDQQSLVEDEDPGDLREVRGLGLFISSPKLNLSRAVGKRAEVSPPRKTPPISSVNSSIYETIIAKASPLLKAAADQKRESEEALSDTVEAPIAINSQTAAPPTPELARERQGDMAEAVTPSEEQIPNEELRVKYGQLLAEKEWLQMQHEELLKKMDLLEQDYLKQREELEDYPQKLSEAEDLCRRRQQEVAFLAETANIFHQALNTIREELEELKCRNVQIERTKKGFEKEATDAKNAQTECQGMCRAKEEEIANLTKKLEEYRLRSEESETKLQATKEEYKRTLEEMRECRNWIDKARSEQIQRDEDQIRFCDRRLMELLSKRHAFQHLSTSPFVQHQALADFLASPLATLPSSFHSLANSPRSATFRHLPPRNTNSTASIRSNWPRSPASSRQSWQSSQRGASSHAGASTVSNPEPLEWITPDYGDASPGPSRLSLEIADLQKRINLSGLVLSRPLSDQYYAQLSLDSPSRPEPLRIQGILDRGQEEETIRDGALGKVEDEPQYSPSENATRESREGSTQVPVEANPQPQAGQGADVQPHQLKSSGSEISIVGQGLELLEETSPLHKGRPVSETAGPSITLSPSSHHVDLDNDAGSALADTAQSENQRRRTSISERSRGTAGNLAPIKTKPNAFQSSSTRGPPPRSSIPPSDVVGEDRLTSPSRSPHSEKAQDSAATSSAVECHQTPGLRQRRSISPQHQSVEPLHNPLSVEERLRMRSTSRSPPDVKVGRWIMMVGDDSPGGSTLGGSTLIGSDYSDQMKDYSRLDPIGGAWIAALGSGSPSPTSTRQVTEIHLFPNLSNSTENVAGVANDLQSRGTRESGTFLSSCRRASAQAAETQTNFVSESTTDSIISKGIKILKQLPIYERRTESISSESSKAVTTPSISPVMSFTDILDGLEQVSDDDGSQIRDSASESGPEPTERELEFEDDPVMTGKTSRGAGKEIQFTWGAAAIVSTTWQEEEASPTAEREGDARAQYESRPSCTPTFYCTSSSLSGYVDRSPQQLLLLIFVAYVALALFVLGRGPLASTLNVGTCSTNSHTTRIPWCALRDRQTRDSPIDCPDQHGQVSRAIAMQIGT
ncbi:hypothetical protein A1O3_00108 [Capronia epimyces CBS 606.96]|uniref:Uncharacterized protein n=1 Tax=Capronia epimyces CBS 606.96 TaxID=1182542 RepID=W9YPG6_9EURO|nr:uncharacterized protein A1O3_00108 [Capronia epimyces CBS 606.96]EXJ91560.1 hypothetical protein A1O3_00108 [Capronia epimyces CBS 606.96]